MRRLVLLLILTVTRFIAQPLNTGAPGPSRTNLTIRVVDSLSGAGIPDAAVDVLGTADSPDIDDVPRANSVGVSIVAVPRNGAFVIHAGAAGYADSLSSIVSTKQDAVTVTVRLDRAVTIFGHIRDSLSGQPLAGVSVNALRLSFIRGMPQIVAFAPTAPTDADGRYEIRGLLPGDYVIETNGARDLEDSDPAAARYPRQIWPGGRDLADASPLYVSPGASFDFGTISLGKRILPTVRFHIVGDCAGRRYDVRLLQTYAKGGLARAQVESVPCDGVSSFAHVSPGAYALVATPGDDNSDEIADKWLEVTDSEINTDLVLRSPPLAKVHGRLIVETDDTSLTQSLQNVSISFLSAEPEKGLASGAPLSGKPAKTDAKGSFEQQFYTPSSGKVTVSVTGLPPSLYAEALAYNGSRISGNEFTLNGFAISQDLDIVCSANFGTISGKVVTSDNEAADILLVPWPNDGVAYPSQLTEVRADPSGAFTFSPVRPGHYKLLAVPDRARQKWEAPFRIMKALPGAIDVGVSSAAASSVKVERLEQ